MKNLSRSERWMYYSGILAATGLNVDINDLKHIQDLLEAEEQGLLLKLPCKVGDAVYSRECGMIVRDFVYSFTKDKNGLWAINIHGGIIGLFGSSVFVTLEEAEKALAEMGRE